jgi:ribosomal protein S17
MGPAASQMERRGVATEKGDINREIAADNKLLKEIKARITRLYNWSKEQSTQSQGRESIMDFLFQARQDTAPASQYAKVKALKENVALFNFLQANGISSMPELYEKVSAMNGDYYDLRGKIVKAERRISVLTERLEMWAQYQKYKPVRQKLDKVSPGNRELFELRYSAAPTSQYARVKALKENVALFNFLQANSISSMPELYEKVSAMNSGYYDLRGKIVKAERRISVLTERLEMWVQYQKYKPVRQKLDKVSPGKREQFEKRHSAALALFDAAVRYLDALKASGEAITPRA